MYTEFNVEKFYNEALTSLGRKMKVLSANMLKSVLLLVEHRKPKVILM